MQNMRKCAAKPGTLGTSCARTQRCDVQNRTTRVGSSRSRRALSSASTLVGSETTSVPRSAETTRFCVVSATLDDEPSGASGDNSTASKSLRGGEQVRIELDQRPLVDVRKLHEAVALPLLDECAGSAVLGALAHRAQQQRPDLRRGHATRERRIGLLAESRRRPRRGTSAVILIAHGSSHSCTLPRRWLRILLS